ncbi:lanthionine synthetase C family protein [Streptomyces sp. SBT349]|uniref:lanthionine synthetase C family protein n=1 Tax=Streptomyces sp. SBT349 TaxID=1580539 RepID=UPI00066E6B8D|nr:lanthionine synthetase C family protein [Streptomyces sp. SBT349]
MNFEQALETADRLARPDAPGLPADQSWWPQSLAHGVLGIALLHAEVGAAGLRPLQRVHDWLTAAARRPVTTGASTGLFYGAPAAGFALSSAAAVHPGAYRRALASLDARIAADARRRVKAARDRITAGRLPVLAEFDTIRGLAGIGAHLLRRDPQGEAVRAVLEYLVALTDPLTDDGRQVPGWWTLIGPTGHPDEEFPGGHGNAGLAHGIGGPLALLALATLRGVAVPGQRDAIDAICAWLDFWRTDTGTGPLWPYLVRRSEHDTGSPRPRRSGTVRRPSWCYGTAGAARVQQLAALATGDAERRRIAEDALVRALADPAQRAATTDASLCHGYAGLAHIAARAAADADKPAAARLRQLAPELLDAAQPAQTEGLGVLEGAAGAALAALAQTTSLPPATGWDACLLIA